MATQPPQKLLRVGVVQGGRIVDERLMQARQPVTVGKKWRCTLTLATDDAPEELVLFDVKNGKYVLHFDEKMRGRVATPDGTVDLDQWIKSGKASKAGSGYQLVLEDGWRGKITLGSASFLFQFVSPAPLKALPQLPANMQGGVLRFAATFMGLSGAFLAFLIFSAVTQLGLALYLTFVMPPPERIDRLDAQLDVFARLVPVEPPPPPEVEPEESDEGDDPSDEAAEEEPEPQAAPPEPTPAPTPPPERPAEPPPAPSIQQSELAALFQSDDGVRTGFEVTNTPGTSRAQEVMDRMREQTGGTGATSSVFAGGSGEGAGRIDAPTGGGESLDVPSGGGPAVAEAPRPAPTLRVTVRPGAADTRGTGTIDSGDLQRTLNRYQRQVQSCYQRIVNRDPSAQGRAVLRFKIDMQGRTDSVTMPTNQLGSEFENCVLGEVRRWRFPAPEGGEVWIQLPYVFQTSQ